jgi:hypothetical protein
MEHPCSFKCEGKRGEPHTNIQRTGERMSKVYWADATTTYKVIASSEKEARDLIERYEEGDEYAMSKVKVKDQSFEIDEVED